MASLREMPVISSAARLKDMMRHSWSTVKTPSDMLSKMISVTLSGIGVDFGFFMRLGNEGHICRCAGFPWAPLVDGIEGGEMGFGLVPGGR
jgi:hypothetical protein